MALNTLPAGAFADDAISSDKINLANNFAFTGTVTGAAKIGQVVHASTSSVVNTTSSSFADSNITAQITPSATSSKIFIMIRASFQLYGGGTSTNATAKFRVINTFDSSDNTLFTSTELPRYDSFDNNQDSLTNIIPIDYIDSPNTTSQCTIKLQIACVSGHFSTQVSGNRSDIFLQEILA
tara:strand:+ start:486 stop:1028 length:543 start_codon:yes stop_codon:yes gene_type:complete